MEAAETLGLTSHSKDEKEDKIVNKEHPLYCKACQKMFAKETVFNAHLTGQKHIKNLRKLGTPFAKAEADRLEAKLQNKQKHEALARAEAAKRKRDGTEEEEEAKKAAKTEGADKKEEEEKPKAPQETRVA